MIFSKVIAGFFMVGGVAQSAYFFDIHQAIKKQFEDNTNKEAKRINQKNQENTKAKDEIKKEITVIQAAQIEAKKQEDKIDGLWKDLHKGKSFWSSKSKKTMVELTEDIKNDESMLQSNKQQIVADELTIKQNQDEVQKLETERQDPKTGWFRRTTVLPPQIFLKKHQLSNQQTNIESLKTNTTNLEKEIEDKKQILDNQKELKNKQEKMLILITKLNANEDSLE